jgi:hypothetical protein
LRLEAEVEVVEIEEVIGFWEIEEEDDLASVLEDPGRSRVVIMAPSPRLKTLDESEQSQLLGPKQQK